MFDAMMLKREIDANFKIDVKIHETSKDGLVLRIMENKVNRNSVSLIIDFVKTHKLNLLLDNEVYFISEQILNPSKPSYLSE
jgi:hypothetical protein